MLLSLMHWNRVLLTVLKECAGNDLWCDMSHLTEKGCKLFHNLTGV
jgi:hypothetical protein